ncbi:MAG: Wzy polymerase domain-containing protein [Aquificota bacterium]|nr:Wzy polymerase domain-containing protein [Aquificota bacterium]
MFLSAVKVLKRGEITAPEGRMALLVFILLSVSSSLFNPPRSKELFLIQSFHLFSIFLIWLSLNQFRLTRHVKDRILAVILGSALIEALIGIVQFAGLYRFIPVTPLEGGGFVWGAFQQKNLFGSFIALGLIISLHMISSPLTRFKKLLNFFLFAVPLPLSVALVFSNSRTAWLGFLIGSTVILASRFRLYSTIKRRVLMWLLFAMIGTFVGVHLYGGSESYRVAVLERESSNVQRILMLKTSMKMFLEQPLTGFGFSNFPSLYMHYQAEVVEENENFKRFAGGFVSHPHNEIANIAVQSGILGLIGLSVVVVTFMRILYKIGLQKSGLYLGLLTPLLIHSLLEYPLELSVIHFFTFVLLLSFITSHTRRKLTLNLSKTQRYLGFAIAVFLFLVSAGFTLKTFQDYMRMTLFAVEFEKGNFKPELLEGARKNPYLNLWAEKMYMVGKLKTAVESKDTEFLKEFVLWSEVYRRKLPLEEVYQAEALALMVLGREYKNLALLDESMKVTEEGLKLYPNSEKLRSLKGMIFKEAMEVLAESFSRFVERSQKRP